MFLKKKWGNFRKIGSKSLEKYGLEKPRGYNFCKEENLKVQQGFSYHIKDDFFGLVKDKYLMSNKEDGNYRPHFYAVQDKKNPSLY